MARPIYIKNTTASGIKLNDLSGMYVASGQIRNLREFFTIDDIDFSEDLRTLISGGQVVLNDGEQDLTTEESFDLGSLPTFYDVPQSLLDLNDTPATYSGAAKLPLIVKDNEDGVGFGLIPETAISGTYFVSYEGGRLLRGATGNRPDLVYIGPVAGLAFDDAKTESCYGSFKVPYAWYVDTDIELRINFMLDESQTGSTSCAWHLDFQTYAYGETYGSKNVTQLRIDTQIPNNAVAGTYIFDTLNIHPDDVDNPIEIGDTFCFQFYRMGLETEDTMTGDSVLISLSFELKTGDVSQLAG